jgi:1,2-diacylglycerol 3-beta-galactosyltransferase
MEKKPMTKKILLLMADTGGGHRSCAEAVLEAIRCRQIPGCEVEMVDVLTGYAPFPINKLDRLYPYMTRFSRVTWEPAYRFTNTPERARLLMRTAWPIAQETARKVLVSHPSDLIVSFHPLFNYAMLWAKEKEKNDTPMVTMVTDMATIHAVWCTPGMVRYLVPTQQAARLAADYGLDRDKIDITGLPISRRFADLTGRPKREVRRNLDLDPDLPTVLLMGGGQGMGRMYPIARALASIKMEFQLVIVAGRNPALKLQLQLANWKIPVRIYGFTREIPVLMAASDVLVTKAGPSTVAEALAMGLPMIISGYIPGQEDGNMKTVVRGRAGVYAPKPKQMTQTLREWLAPDSNALTERAQAARKMGHPEAADNVAEIICKLIGCEEQKP